jgi:RNA polymerase sigma-70 factor, ECF subfamily
MRHDARHTVLAICERLDRVTGYPLAAGQFFQAPASREVLAARAALAEGLRALRESLAELRALSLNDMRSIGVRGDGGMPRTRNRPHPNDVSTRHQPGGNSKPVGVGRALSPMRQPTAVESQDHLGVGAYTEVLEPPSVTEPITEPGNGGDNGPKFPSRPEPGDPANEVWSLVERAQNGETAAFGLIYDRYMDTVFRFIYFRVGNRQLAEDLTSDTFLRALKRISSFTWQGRDLGAWLVTIARNLVADHFKSGRYRLEITTGDVLDAEREDRGLEGSPESTVVDHITNVTLLTAVKHLNPEQQECIVLRFLQGFSVAETAKAMGKNEGAIKALQYRAVRALARLLPDGFHQ